MTTKFDSHAILVEHYKAQIEREFRWDKIVHEASNESERNEWGDRIGRVWLGTVLGLFPSGKIYTCWTAGLASSDIRRDEAYNDALEAVALQHNGGILFDDDSVFFGMSCFDEPSTAEDEMEDAEYFDVNE